jgi:hypothetical protein
LARREIRADESSAVSNASVTLTAGVVTDPNLAHACTSGHLLNIKLIGDFPHIVTDPPPNAASPQDATVHAVLLTAEATTGRACLKSVQTGDVSPDPGSVALNLG